MQPAAVILCIALGVLAFYQAVAALVFVVHSRRWRTPQIADEDLPKVALLLGLKGADPYLGDTLRGLMTQDYQRYEMHVVVNSRDDPAWEIVEAAIRDTAVSRVHLEEYRELPGVLNCTTSKVVQAARKLDDSVEVIAMADGDLVPHAGWLRELVAPLADDARTGATFGNRWFMPAAGRWGSLVRYLWNSAAVVPMFMLGMPWGGCFAIRASAVRRGKLIDKWQRILALDAATPADLRKQDLRVRFVPSLMMVNREECGVSFALNFVQRQLTWTRLYHGQWWQLTAHAAVTTGVMVAAAAVALVAACMGGAAELAWAGGGLAGYLVTMLLSVAGLEHTVRRPVRERGESTGWLTLRAAVKLPVAVFLTQLMHAAAVCLATFRRRVKWRGAVLEIRGPYDIRTIDEESAAGQTEQAAPEKTSL